MITIAGVERRPPWDLIPSTVASLEGNSVAELVSKFKIVNAKIPIYSHLRVLVISEELGKVMMEVFF